MIAEGQTEQQPISLSGIKREEFEHLLRAMYHDEFVIAFVRTIVVH